MGELDEGAAADATRRWVAGVVIGLNLRPFARRVADAGRVRYAVTPAAAAGVTEVAGDPAALEAIPERNIKTLRRLGRAEILARLRAAAGPDG